MSLLQLTQGTGSPHVMAMLAVLKVGDVCVCTLWGLGASATRAWLALIVSLLRPPERIGL